MEREGQRKHGLLFGITARTLMCIAGGLLVLSYLSTYINPSKAWYMTVFGLLFLPLLIVNAGLLAWALYRKSKAAMIPLLCLLPALLFCGRFVQIGSRSGAKAGDIKIISYNVGRFALYRKGSFTNRRECADSVFAFLRRQDADIICLQEFQTISGENVRDFIRKRLKGYDIQYYFNVGRREAYGNVTLSRFPATSKGKINFEKSSNLVLYSDYKIDGRPLRVYNCHLESYNISLSRLARMADYKAAVNDTEYRMKRSIRKRPEQVEQILENFESGPSEACITGDFNDNPMSYTYNRLIRGRKDSFCEAGSGVGATYSVFRPLLRIDYILYPEMFRATGHEVIHKNYSDHYPVLATIDMHYDNE